MHSAFVPFMSMLRTAADPSQPWAKKHYVLVYFVSQDKPVLFGAELAALQQQMGTRLKLEYVKTDGSRSGYAGLLQHHVPQPAFEHYEFFLCGPSGLSENIERGLGALGVSGSRIHRELFEWV